VIKNFDEVKKHLAELSDLLNKFKSEQVQLKILERIFRGSFDDTADERSPVHNRHPRDGRKEEREQRPQTTKPMAARRNRRQGQKVLVQAPLSNS
jgi:hypothetical protein